MKRRDFFEYWTESFLITKATLERFAEPDLSRTIIPGARSPGVVFAHIYSHVNGMFNACVRRELYPHELSEVPEDVDLRRKASLLRYAQRTMEGMLAHATVDESVWQQTIKTPGGDVQMNTLCLQAFAHEIHHRGQLIMMLRALGVDPPEVCRHG